MTDETVQNSDTAQQALHEMGLYRHALTLAVGRIQLLASLVREDHGSDHPVATDHILAQCRALLGQDVEPAQYCLYPATLTDAMRGILGRPNFTCAGLAEALRHGGVEIKRKAEDEQAVVIDWLLKQYMRHGPERWVAAANSEIARIRDEYIAAHPEAQEVRK